MSKSTLTVKTSYDVFNLHRPGSGKLSLLDASKKTFADFLELRELKKRYDSKLLRLQDTSLPPPTHIADVGKTFLRAVQLPTKDPRVVQLRLCTTARFEAAIQDHRQSLLDCETEFYAAAATGTTDLLLAYASLPQLVLLLKEKTLLIAEADLHEEASMLLVTINNFLDAENNTLAAVETVPMEEEKTPTAAILAALKSLEKEVASLKTAKNEPSRSNLPQQSKKNPKTPPPPQKKQQKSRGRSPSRKRDESRGRSASAASTARRDPDRGRADRSRSTSRSKPSFPSSR